MAGKLDSIKDIIMNVVNGKATPTALVGRTVLEAAKTATAEAEHIAKTAKVVTPQITKVSEEISSLEAKKASKEAELITNQAELTVIEKEIESQEALLEETKKTKEAQRKAKAKQVARKKSKGEAVDIDTDNTVGENRDKLNELKAKEKECKEKISNNQKDIDDISAQIVEQKNMLKILEAQLSPTAALAQAKIEKEEAQHAVDKASTPEAKAQAEKKLEEASAMEETIQQVSDENSASIEMTEQQQEPEMLMLQADFELMNAGVNTLNYLISNIPVFFTAASASLGANGGGPLPMLPTASLPMGNVLYGYAHFILASIKSASIRFMANAQKINYVPTTEMNVINQIPVCEASLAGLSSIAPAGAALSAM